ncbi:MAG: NAD-dependent epimerase/dehydratase family protein [Rhodobiaceae bacterium]|nr:NAD-dependent epimerase/dehydratase family protein [Rhodobiaceae bacterium]
MTGKFLILGANSFSGATFADFVAEQGIGVIATSRSEQSASAFLPYTWTKRQGTVRFETVDLNHDLDKLDAILKSDRPTHVVNFAAQSMVGQSWENPDHWMMTNVVSTVRLHELLRRCDWLERYVHVTTPEVYGSTDGWVKEDTPFNPSTPYAVSRAAADMSLRTYVDQYDFPAVSTRAANVFGPGQQLYRIIPRTILAGIAGKKMTLDGGGVSTRSFITMRDVSDATLKVALSGKVGDTYHISTDRMVSIRELVEKIFDDLGADFDSLVTIGPERPGKDSAYMLDSGKIRSELGWSDQETLEDGIAQTVEWANRFKDELVATNPDYVHKP